MTKSKVGVNNLWYVQHGDEVQGPLPAKLIARYLILGRVTLATKVSQDRTDWRPVSEFPALIPNELQNADSGRFARERLEAARRWEDERAWDEGDYQEDHAERRDHEEEAEDKEQHAVRRRAYRVRDSEEEKRKERRFALVSMIAIALFLGGIAAVAINEAWIADPGLRDCSVGPAPGVQWNHCSRRGAVLTEARLIDASMVSMDLTSASLRAARLERANLSYATLVGASLSGANLDDANMVGADLRDADLTGATLHATNLAYADLRGANITDADFSDAVLDRAIWLDGRICGEESRGVCRQTDMDPAIDR
ncbi:MAG: pentapeptide repeat-containing protein [Gammaproteobacteria bacterium]|nr:pentapeptide repeat-containing protein [Gammaproteobacteria bacterium]